MTTIRDYEENDAEAVGKLIADTYSEFNLDFVPAEDLGLFLGPFRYAGSKEEPHQEAIARVIHSAMVFVAEDEGEIVGVLRGPEGQTGKPFCQGSSSSAWNWAATG